MSGLKSGQMSACKHFISWSVKTKCRSHRPGPQDGDRTDERLTGDLIRDEHVNMSCSASFFFFPEAADWMTAKHIKRLLIEYQILHYQIIKILIHAYIKKMCINIDYWFSRFGRMVEQKKPNCVGHLQLWVIISLFYLIIMIVIKINISWSSSHIS